MSQAQLARDTGISRPALVKLLNGKTRSPRLETTRAIAQALGVSPVHLMRLLTGEEGGKSADALRTVHAGDNAASITDVTMPPGAAVTPGERFEKVWDVRNTGAVDWRGRRLRCVDEALSAQLDDGARARYFLQPDSGEILVPYVAPGDTARLSVWFTAPTLPTACISVWKIVDAAGQDFSPQLDPLNVMVLVAGSAV